MVGNRDKIMSVYKSQLKYMTKQAFIHSSIGNTILLKNFVSLPLINYRCIDGANVYIIKNYISRRMKMIISYCEIF
jgi:hypothetical protein